jgi:hypothetical protein
METPNQRHRFLTTDGHDFLGFGLDVKNRRDF